MEQETGESAESPRFEAKSGESGEDEAPEAESSESGEDAAQERHSSESGGGAVSAAEELEETSPPYWVDRLVSYALILVGRTHLLSEPFLSSIARKVKEDRLRQVSVVGGVLVHSQSGGLTACKKAGVSVAPFEVVGDRDAMSPWRHWRLRRKSRTPLTSLSEHRVVAFIQRASRRRPVLVVGRVSKPMEGMLSFGIGCDYIRDAVLECADLEGVSVFLETVSAMPRLGIAVGLEDMARRGVALFESDAKLPHYSVPQASIAERALVSRIMEILSYEKGKALYLEQNSICAEIAGTIVRNGAWEGWGSADLLGPHHRALFEAGRFHGFVGSGTERQLLEGKMVGTHALGDESFYRWLDGRNDVLLASSRDIFRSARFQGSVAISQISNLDFHLRAFCPEGRGQEVGPGALSMALQGVARDEKGVFIACLNDVEIDRWGRAVPCFAPKGAWGGRTKVALGEMCPYALGRLYVVTPYGLVDLAGKLPGEAVRALIEIATPDLRRPLRKAFSNFA